MAVKVNIEGCDKPFTEGNPLPYFSFLRITYSCSISDLNFRDVVMDNEKEDCVCILNRSYKISHRRGTDMTKS